jgi:hypothetical protein
LDSFCNPRLAVIYLSPWLLCRFDLAARPILIDRGEHRQAAGSVTKVIAQSGRCCATLCARGNGQETTMRNPISAIAIAFVVVAPCTALAQSSSLSFPKIEYEYTKQKPDGSNATTRRLTVRKAGEQPKEYLTTTQNKPLNPTVNPAAKGGGSNGPALYQKLNTGVHYNNATINLR